MSAKVVAITGGGQGIGRGIAFAFAEAGYAVSIVDPAADAGEEAAAHIRKLGAQAFYEQGDTSQPEDVTRWISRTVESFGCPSVLVNNAGINANTPFLELSVADFDRVQAVNVRSTFLCSQALARELVKRQRGGAIINIASTRAFMSEANTEAYTASKGAIVALTHGMAISLGGYGIRVNSISPGWIETSDWQFSKRAKKLLTIPRPTTASIRSDASACPMTSQKRVCF
ncbi:SDR family NAD(P)-dependent oxidoreductase [Hyphomicrobium sp.]|jgi:NAD(P)-dependent dehydrogenase (short-subunit alcohol dehydrogenase family)|uniref:SDR family NAD(P)-dependent oxidoreductase n=1 Tax=Hyphomicrobium sp. TaxID=82 RepID=UPI0035661E3C